MSTQVSSAPTAARNQGVDTSVVLVALGGICALVLACFSQIDTRQGLLALVGVGFGYLMYQASFSFAGGWRAAITQGSTLSIRAQMLAIGLAAIGMMPILQMQEVFGQAVTGAVGPVGISLFVGSLMFGFGMQLGGGCASGTLFTVGGGSTRMLITLAFFILGALIGTAHLPWWTTQWSLGTVQPAHSWGLLPALALQLAGLLAVYLLARRWELRKRQQLQSLLKAPSNAPAMQGAQRLWRGYWPLAWAAVGLALLSVANLLLTGQPWSVTFAFNLWGAKLASLVGVDVSSWEYWTWSMPAQALQGPVLAESTSVTNFGLVLGALLAAGLAGRFAPVSRIPLGSALAAAVGGVLMGYGARLAFGCNVGALFSGLASGSMHGWVWFALAFIGSLAGVRARTWFGLEK